MAITDLIPGDIGQRLRGLVDRVRNQILEKGIAPVKSEECKEIPQLLRDIRAQLEAALERDAADLAVIRQREDALQAGTDTAFRERLRQAQAARDEQVKQVRMAAVTQWERLKLVSANAAEYSQTVPDQLKAKLDDWDKRAKDAGDLADSLPELILLEGWTGPAARRYGLRAMVQAKAFEEHRQLPALYAKLVELMLRATLVELTFVLFWLRHAKQRNEVGLVAVSGEVFPRTRAVTQNMGKAEQLIRSRESEIEATDQEFCRIVDDGMAARNIIKNGWPTGTQLAFEKVGHICPDYTPQDFTKYEEALREEQEEQ
ncbi:hypothetical protein [Tessaracoccus sp. OH4464_COT-324]|uniref:hypothetical protein n=1 Tax=Tessaracoccus sp. OH4464_COT-324 TaxID=2491059 RepID=UPI000F631A92|nr:hypothetical protein [Tessaracoccus sp. OH4464_COT-324]RRD43897.1 hypothetical protein EII42_12080 [Tessaracoccus sp. OH4464_COT-324]